MDKVIAYIAVGSNLGDRTHWIQEGRRMLARNPDIRFLRFSKIHETDPVGGPKQGKYFNAVWEIETQLSPNDLLKELLSVEQKLGRVRTQKNGPRTLDLDILFYGDLLVENPGLSIPHPRLDARVFVLKPLSELNPDLIHPRLKKSVAQLLQAIT